jgi:hypothetical protein
LGIVAGNVGDDKNEIESGIRKSTDRETRKILTGNKSGTIRKKPATLSGDLIPSNSGGFGTENRGFGLIISRQIGKMMVCDDKYRMRL